mgnify:CR=1 FL=1
MRGNKNMFQTVFLALLQSLTEFLPVSSSGHLAVFPVLFGWKPQGLVFDAALHAGTLFAVLFYFRKDVATMIRGGVDFLCRRFSSPAFKMALNIGIAAVPVLAAGFFAHDFIEENLRSPHVIAVMLIVFGILLYVADRAGKSESTVEQMTAKQAFFIGLAQVLALIPGASRSGVTMTAGRVLGLNRKESARFSMLLSIPTVAAAGAWAILSVFRGDAAYPASLTQELSVGVGVSAVGGFAAIFFLMKWLKSFSFAVFAVYRVALGTFLLFFL